MHSHGAPGVALSLVAMGWEPRQSPQDSWFREYAEVVERLDRDLRRELEPHPVPFTQFAVDHPLWNHPLLFRDTFPELAPELAGTLAAAARWISAAVLYSDGVVDRQREPSAELVVHEEIARRGHRLLARLVPPHADFWARLDRYSMEYVSSQLLEQEVHSGARPWARLSEKDHRAMSMGRAALGKLVPAAMAELGGSTERLPALERSYDLFNVSHQLYDDLLDWKSDARRRRLTWVLWRLSERSDAVERWSIEGLRAAVHMGGFSLSVLDESERLLDQACEEVRGLPAQDWLGFLSFERGRTRALRRDLGAIVAQGAST